MISNISSTDRSFDAYRRLLQRQIAGRTPLLNDVLSSVERNIEALYIDLDTMKERSDDTR